MRVFGIAARVQLGREGIVSMLMSDGSACILFAATGVVRYGTMIVQCGEVGGEAKRAINANQHGADNRTPAFGRRPPMMRYRG
jgi:hypothetical protein